MYNKENPLIKSQFKNIDYQHQITPEEISTLLECSKADSVKKIVVGGAIINKNSKVLIVKRAKQEDFLPDLLEFPSGHVEEGETLIEGLVREINEETSFNNIHIEKYLNFFDYNSKSGKKVRQFNFLVKQNCDRDPILNIEEHQSYYWCNYEEASKIGCDKTVLDCLKIIYPSINEAIQITNNAPIPLLEGHKKMTYNIKENKYNKINSPLFSGYLIGKLLLNPSIRYLDDTITKVENKKSFLEYFAPKMFDVFSTALFYTTYTVAPSQFGIAGKLMISKMTVDFFSTGIEISQIYFFSLIEHLASNFIIFSCAFLARDTINKYPLITGTLLSSASELVNFSLDIANIGYNNLLGQDPTPDL